MTDGAVAAGVSSDLPDLQLRSDQRLSAAALVLLAAPALWFARYDLIAVFSGKVDPAGLLRLVLAVVPGLAAAAVTAVRTRRDYSRVIFLASIGIAACYALGSLAFASGTPLRAPLLASAVMYIGLPNALWRQLLPPILMGAVLAATNTLPFAALADATSGVFAFIAFNGLGCLAVSRRLQLERQVEDAWRQEFDARRTAERALEELDKLRGIIPICSHCRKVRTELGGWQQLEQYVRDRSSADFSHGICPSCFMVHYSDNMNGA